MKIIFSHFGFSSSEAFIVKDGRQFNIGSIFVRFPDRYEFVPYNFCMEHYVNRQHYLTADEIPNSEQTISEYKKQLNEKGISINNEIIYAG